RLLHGERYEIIAFDLDLTGLHGVELARKITRKDRAMRRLIAQLDAHLGAIAIDELGSLPAADQRDVVACHQKLGAEERTVGGAEYQNVASHYFLPGVAL